MSIWFKIFKIDEMNRMKINEIDGMKMDKMI